VEKACSRRAAAALSNRLRDFPFEAAANPFEQVPIVKPKHRLARFRTTLGVER
jgi:hypothetical protein